MDTCIKAGVSLVSRWKSSSILNINWLHPIFLQKHYLIFSSHSHISLYQSQKLFLSQNPIKMHIFYYYFYCHHYFWPFWWTIWASKPRMLNKTSTGKKLIFFKYIINLFFWILIANEVRKPLASIQWLYLPLHITELMPIRKNYNV